MIALIIDIASDPTPRLAQLKATTSVETIFSYLSSIGPNGPKCWTVERVKAAASAGFRIGLVHEGWGGVEGKGISAADGDRDGHYCVGKARQLGAPKDACVYFACDQDFTRSQIAMWVIPYFKTIRAAFAGSGYRVGVYGSGLVCQSVKNAGLADSTWLAQSKGWVGYQEWLLHADMVQGPEQKLDGLEVDTDTAQGNIGDYVPVWDAPSIVSEPATAPKSSLLSGLLAGLRKILRDKKAA